MFVAFEVPQVGLQRECSKQEISLLSLDTLRLQDLLPQVPIVIIARHAITTTQADIERQTIRENNNQSCQSSSAILFIYHRVLYVMRLR